VKSLLDDEVEPCTTGRQVQPPGPQCGAIPKKTVKVRKCVLIDFPHPVLSNGQETYASSQGFGSGSVDPD
jgi:hypothetical protein